MNGHPYTVCLTGGIGSGKSVVARICRLSSYDVCVYDCDSEAKILMETDHELRKQLTDIFGETVILPQGGIDRQRLAEIIFSSETHRRSINELVHAAVRKDIAERRGNAPCRIFIVETAIPSTSRLDELTDEVWLVEASEEIRINRAIKRDNSDHCKIKARIDAQKDEFTNLRCNNIKVITNDGTAPLLPQVIELLTNIDKHI